jgi:hypothetical protein
MSEETITVEQATDPDRFEILVDGAPAGFSQFADSGTDRIFFHTSMDPAFGGRGLGGKVVSAALDSTREAGLNVVALCPFVKGYVEKHPSYADLTVDPTQAHVDVARAQPQI